MSSAILDAGEHQSFIDSPNDEPDKKRKEESNNPVISEDNRDRGCRNVLRRLARSFLEGVVRSLGNWIIDEIRTACE